MHRGQQCGYFRWKYLFRRATASAYGLEPESNITDNGDPARHLLTAHIAGQAMMNR